MGRGAGVRGRRERMAGRSSGEVQLRHLWRATGRGRGGVGSGGYAGCDPEVWGAVRLWGGQAAEIEILEISVGVRMVK